MYKRQVFARHADPRDLLTPGADAGRVLVPAGAIGGLDILSAAAGADTDGAHLRHYTIKCPVALKVTETCRSGAPSTRTLAIVPVSATR